MKSIKKQAIEHYDRMIAWVETQDGNNLVSSNKMIECIGEEWYLKDCSYCSQYRKDLSSAGCELCELTSDRLGCCNGLWDDMEESLTWKTWLKYAKLVRQYIIDKG